MIRFWVAIALAIGFFVQGVMKHDVFSGLLMATLILNLTPDPRNR